MRSAASVRRRFARRIPFGVFSASGFTLIEILLSITLLAVLLSIALPRLGEAHRGISLREQAARLDALLSHARNTAVFSGRNVTLAVDRERLRFELDIANDEAASRRLRLNPGGALELPSSLALECDRETIRFSPIGLADPFEIALSNETGRVTLRSGDYSGKPVLEEGPAS